MKGNFLSWKLQIMSTLKGYGLEKFINREARIPPKVIVVDSETSTRMENP